MLSRLRIRSFELLASMLLLASLIGCSAKIVLYPIQDTDIYVRENDDVCMSEFYFNEVLQAKIKGK